MKKTSLYLLLVGFVFGAALGCNKGLSSQPADTQTETPEVVSQPPAHEIPDEIPKENEPSPQDEPAATAAESPSTTATPSVAPNAGAQPTEVTQKTRYVIVKDTPVFELVSADLLQLSFVLKVGSEIELAKDSQAEPFSFKLNEKDSPQRSSTGFKGPIEFKLLINESRSISDLNNPNKKYYVSSAIFDSRTKSNDLQTHFKKIEPLEPKAEYLKTYRSSGRPLTPFTSSLVKRFGTKLNRGVALTSQTSPERLKWRRIFSELQKVADRSVDTTPRSLLFMDQKAAEKASLDFEKNRIVSPVGAWSIAVNATAPREGFAHVPCAEFMSEVLRQAYRRGNYSIFEDFNGTRGNELHFLRTASVEGLANALVLAQWVPWDSMSFRPPVGAIIMHASARSPGHTYMSAGFDGRYIIDNGAPSGRDLSQTSEYAINLMYLHGAFFLPPGIQPVAW